MARAVYDGVACSARLLLDALQSSAGTEVQSLNAGGGGFRTPVWNQIRANVLGVALDKVAVDDPGTLGAAGLAAVAIGLHDSVQDAFDIMVQIDQRYEPDSRLRDFHDERMALYKQTYENTRSISSHWA
jgi:xylulokinase